MTWMWDADGRTPFKSLLLPDAKVGGIWSHIIFRWILLFQLMQTKLAGS